MGRVGHDVPPKSGPGAGQNHDFEVILIMNKMSLMTGMRIDLSGSISAHACRSPARWTRDASEAP